MFCLSPTRASGKLLNPKALRLLRKYVYAIVIVAASIIGAGLLLSYKNCRAVKPNNADYLTEIKTKDEFNMLKGKPLSNQFSNVESIKLSYDVRKGKLYFINSTRYRYHIDFAQKVLGYNLSLEMFNATNYSDSRMRDYYLANLNRYADRNIYTLEFVGEDLINAKQIQELYDAVKSLTYFGDSVKLFVDNDHLLSLDNASQLHLPKVYPAEIYAGQRFQPIRQGVTFGFLRKVDNLKQSYSSINRNDIIVIKGTPLSLPVCAGVLTDALQTPLSHVNILCQNRGTPSAAVIDLWKNDLVERYADKLVKLTVTQNNFEIQTTTHEEADAFWKSQKPRQTFVLKPKVDVSALLDISKVRFADNDLVGSKAANFSELVRLQNSSNNSFYTPEGAFTIPFYFYHQHIQQPAIKKLVDELLNDSTRFVNQDSLAAQLKKIRKAIRQTTVENALVANVKSKMKASGFESFRFRSSTNAEDIEGFNGAGLYDSKTGTLSDTSKTVEDAILDVWSSVWTLRAYQERELFNIDHRTVMMGILCHRNFPDEAANGVAITSNIYRKGFPGFTVNVQKGDVSVVSPPEGVTCEQFVMMNASAIDPLQDNVSVEYITHSSLNDKQPLLTKEEVEQLYDALYRIKQRFYQKPGFNQHRAAPGYEDFGVDVEFKFDKNGKLYVKQARPYKS